MYNSWFTSIILGDVIYTKQQGNDNAHSDILPKNNYDIKLSTKTVRTFDVTVYRE